MLSPYIYLFNVNRWIEVKLKERLKLKPGLAQLNRCRLTEEWKWTIIIAEYSNCKSSLKFCSFFFLFFLCSMHPLLYLLNRWVILIVFTNYICQSNWHVHELQKLHKALKAKKTFWIWDQMNVWISPDSMKVIECVEMTTYDTVDSFMTNYTLHNYTPLIYIFLYFSVVKWECGKWMSWPWFNLVNYFSMHVFVCCSINFVIPFRHNTTISVTAIIAWLAYCETCLQIHLCISIPFSLCAELETLGR